MVDGPGKLIKLEFENNYHGFFYNLDTCETNKKAFYRLCMDFISFGGGFFIEKFYDGTLSNKKQYAVAKSNREVCFRYDSSQPIHCKESKKCSSDPLHLINRITSEENITIWFTGWFDPYPFGGRQIQASGIKHFEISVHKMSSAGNTIRMEDGNIHTQTIPSESSITRANVNFPYGPALYGISLTVVDNVNNYKKARSFVYYDNSSKLMIDHHYKLTFDSASSETNYTWQTNHGNICLTWVDRYYNDHNVHLSSNVLRPIERGYHGFYDGIYEQTTGVLPVTGTTNVHGIIDFKFKYALKNGKFSASQSVQNFTSQKLCKLITTKDGESYTFEIQAIDLTSKTLKEQTIVHIDASVPDINNVWLVKNGHRQLYVHNSTELSKMDIEFDVLDEHSGIFSIHWIFGTTPKGTELGEGAIGVSRIKVSINRN